MPVFTVRHVTRYEYRRPVRFGEHRLMFRPRDSVDQRLIDTELRVEPRPSGVRWIHDVFGNCVTLVGFDRTAEALSFASVIRLDHTPQNGPEFLIDPAALDYPFAYSADEQTDLAPLIAMENPNDEVHRWARRFLRHGRPTATGHLLMTLCYAIHEGFAYSRRHERGTQLPIVTLNRRRGTCRDFAQLMIEALRSLGFAARFVSGYVYVADRDGPALQGGGATHAWCEVYLPGAGWVEFDPTNGIIGNRDLIRVAVTRSPSQAVPLSGTYEGSANDYVGMSVQVNVTTGADAPAGA